MLIDLGYIILVMMHLLLFVLTIGFSCTRWDFPNDPGFACPDLAAWTEVDPLTEDQAYLEEQADQ